MTKPGLAKLEGRGVPSRGLGGLIEAAAAGSVWPEAKD